MKKIEFILKNFFVPGFLDLLLVPGTLNRLMKEEESKKPKKSIRMFPDELIIFDLVAAPPIQMTL